MAGLVLVAVTWPAFDALFLAGLLRGLIVFLVAVGVAWGLHELFGRWIRRIGPGPREPEPDPTSNPVG